MPIDQFSRRNYQRSIVQYAISTQLMVAGEACLPCTQLVIFLHFGNFKRCVNFGCMGHATILIDGVNDRPAAVFLNILVIWTFLDYRIAGKYRIVIPPNSNTFPD